jgi:hypothetical protein
MTSIRSLTNTFNSLSIKSSWIHSVSQKFQTSAFSTTSAVLGGPNRRLRREKARAKKRKAKARAEELRIQRSAKSDPVLSHQTQFTKSLLCPRQLLSRLTAQSHSRSGDRWDWPLLTNWGISSDDALTLSVGAQAAGLKRIYQDGQTNWDVNDQVLYGNRDNNLVSALRQRALLLDKDDKKKRGATAKVLDLINSNSKSIMKANLERALAYFGRREGDTGSPEAQGFPRDYFSTNSY